MGMIQLDRATYLDKVYGCWLGKNIGGTLGEPLEKRFGQDEMFDVWWYPELPEGGIPNDDLELQLIWLQALKERGPGLTARDLADYWLNCVAYNFDEYGLHKTNLVKGLQPPVSGWYNNWFIDCMGSPIRSEIWACVAPAAPQVAAHYAFQDAICDHAGGESVYGEIFNAVVESCAFVIDDKFELISLGLSAIPASCKTHRAITRTLELYHQGRSWIEAREILKTEFYSPVAQYSPLNLAFQTVGWLWGEDFADALCKAVNCGWDTDCTGATLGAILGIILGRQGLPEKWVQPLGDEITTNVNTGGIKNLTAPTNLHELTEEVYQMALRVLNYWNCKVEIVDSISQKQSPPTFDLDLAALHHYRPDTLKFDLKTLQAEVTYHHSAAVVGDQPSRFTLTLANPGAESLNCTVTVCLPKDWNISPRESQQAELEPYQKLALEFEVSASPDAIELSNRGMIEIWVEDRPGLMGIPLVYAGGFRWLVSPVFVGKNLEDDCGVVETEILTAVPDGWREIWRHDNDLRPEELFDGRQGVVYLAHFVEALKERQVLIGVPNNNRMQFWINGEPIHRTTQVVPLAPNEGGDGVNYAEATLKAGWNQILVKLERGDGEAEAHFILSGVDSEHPINRGDAVMDVVRAQMPW